MQTKIYIINHQNVHVMYLGAHDTRFLFQIVIGEKLHIENHWGSSCSDNTNGRGPIHHHTHCHRVHSDRYTVKIVVQ